jgi:hypothetical protein
MLRKSFMPCALLKKISKLPSSLAFSNHVGQNFEETLAPAILFDRISSGDYISTRLAV